MISLTIAWLALPFFLGFIIYLVPKLDRYLALTIALVSVAYSFVLFSQKNPLTLKLLDNFGVTLIADQLSAFFILTNALVTLAVIIYCWPTDKTAFFMPRLLFYTGVSTRLLFARILSVYMWR